MAKYFSKLPKDFVKDITNISKRTFVKSKDANDTETKFYAEKFTEYGSTLAKYFSKLPKDFIKEIKNISKRTFSLGVKP